MRRAPQLGQNPRRYDVRRGWYKTREAAEQGARHAIRAFQQVGGSGEVVLIACAQE